MLEQVLTGITQVALLTFVVAGMAAMGLSLTVSQIAQPLRDTRMVVGTVLANFVVVPAFAILSARLLPLDDASAAAVILLGCAAGAPFLSTLARLAGGQAALAVGVMVLLMVVTVAFAPIVVPRAVEGATVSAGDIASSLVLFMLVPLGVGLAVNARYPELAERGAEAASRASSVGLLLGIVSGLLVTWREIVASVGSGIFLGAVIVLITGLAAGFVTGLHLPGPERMVLALAGAQRNIAAALVVSTSLGADVTVRTLVAALALTIALLLIATEIGRRHRRAENPASV